MSVGLAVAIGLLAGAHTATWGMYKDCPYEGFTYRKYARSIVIAALLAVAWQLAGDFDLTLASGRLVLFGLTYVTERGVVELYKGFLREEDQSKYFIPMQFHVMGRVVQSRAVRWSVAAAWIAAILLVAWMLRAWQQAASHVSPWLAVLAIGSIGGWLSAFGGAFKDAPIEGFETLKFFRSPVLSLLWSWLIAYISSDYLYIALCGLGFTVATIETYKTFFFPDKPRGKFAGKPIRYPQLLTWRHRFAPLYAAIWIVLAGNIALAYSEPRTGLLARPSVDARCLTVAPGECLQVTVSGHGPDVVLIPGLFGSAFSFRHVVPRLAAAGYRSIVIEPLGVGDSARPRSGDYSLTAQAERIRQALDALEVESPIVVAHSIGASMAFRLASRHPQRVRALVSLEGGPAEEVATPGFRRAMKLRPLLRLLGAGPVRGRIRGMLVSRSGDSSWVTDDVVASYAAGPMRDLGATLDAFSQMAKAREPESLSSRLAALRCPVRLLVGAAPHAGGPSEAEIALLRRTLSSFSVERIPGAGHFLFEEDPDAVLAAIARVAGE